MKKVLSKLLLILICITMFLNISLYLASYNLTRILTYDNIYEIFKDVDIIKVLEQNKKDNLTLLYEKTSKYNIDKTVVDKLLNSLSAKEVVAVYYGNLFNTFLYNKDKKPFNYSSLLTKYTDNLDIILSKFNYNITYSQKEDIISSIKLVTMDLEDIFKDNDIVLDNDVNPFQLLFSNTLRWIFLIIIGICFIAIILLNKPIYLSFIWTGVTTSLASIIYLFIGIFLKNLFTIFPLEANANIINLIQNNMANTVLYSGIITLVIGIIEIIYYRVIKKLKN